MQIGAKGMARRCLKASTPLEAICLSWDTAGNCIFTKGIYEMTCSLALPRFAMTRARVRYVLPDRHAKPQKVYDPMSFFHTGSRAAVRRTVGSQVPGLFPAISYEKCVILNSPAVSLRGIMQGEK